MKKESFFSLFIRIMKDPIDAIYSSSFAFGIIIGLLVMSSFTSIPLMLLVGVPVFIVSIAASYVLFSAIAASLSMGGNKTERRIKKNKYENQHIKKSKSSHKENIANLETFNSNIPSHKTDVQVLEKKERIQKNRDNKLPKIKNR